MKDVALIFDKASELAVAIRETDVYKEYRLALEDLKKHPDLKKQADEFRLQNYEAYCDLEEPVSFADFNSLDLEERRMELAQIPQIDRFLKAELALCRVLQEVESRVAVALDLS